MKDQQKIIDTIKKCLSLAKSSNANEAATALRMAQNLMQKHGVNDLDIQAAQASEESTQCSVKKKPSQWESWLAVACAKAFACQSLLARSLFQPSIWRFIGVGMAPELSRYAFEVLLRQIKRDRAQYIKTSLKRCKRANKIARADQYCESWVNQVHKTIEYFAGNEQQEKIIDAYFKKHYPNIKDLQPRTRKSMASNDSQWQDHNAGKAAGSNANLNRAVNQTQRKKLQDLSA